MTVREMIEQLEMLPDDIPVVMLHGADTVVVEQVSAALNPTSMEVNRAVIL